MCCWSESEAAEEVRWHGGVFAPSTLDLGGVSGLEWLPLRGGTPVAALSVEAAGGTASQIGSADLQFAIRTAAKVQKL